MKRIINFKRLAGGLMAFSMAVGLPSQARVMYAEEEVSSIYVLVDGFLLETSSPPVMENGYVLIGMRELFDSLGANVKWEPVLETVYGSKGELNVAVTVNNTDAFVNRKRITMPVAPKLINGHVMVPLRFVSETFDAKVSWDSQTDTAIIDTGAPDYSAVAADRNRNTLLEAKEVDYEKAIRLLFQTNADIKNQIDGEQIVKDKLEDAQDAYYRSHSVDLTNAKLARAVKSLQSQLENYEEAVQNTRDLIELNFRKTLTAVENAELDIYLLQQKIEIQERELSSLKLKLSLGIANENEVRLAEQELTQSKGKLMNAEISLKSAKLEINAFLGYNATDEIRVVRPDYEGVPKEDLEKYIKTQKTQSYAVRLKEISLKDKEYAVYTHNEFMYLEYQDQENINELKNDVAAAERDLDQTKTDLEKIIRKNYNDILLQEETYKSLKIDYDKAVDTYVKTVVNFQTGRATFLNLENARLAILSAEIKMQQNRMDFSDLLYAFEKPHLQMKLTSSQAQIKE